MVRTCCCSCIWSAGTTAFARGELGGDPPPGNRLAAPQLPGPGRSPDDDAEPAGADVPAIDADVDSGELIAAQLPKVLLMHDGSDSGQVRSCSGEPPRGNQDLGRGQDAHHDSMSACGTRWPQRRPLPGRDSCKRRSWRAITGSA